MESLFEVLRFFSLEYKKIALLKKRLHSYVLYVRFIYKVRTILKVIRKVNMKKLAVLGSSGGNLRSQGGSDPRSIIDEIQKQADAAGIELAYVQFILTSGSMDSISMDAKSQLFTLDETGNLISSKEMTLTEINKLAKDSDEKLARQIMSDEIDGLMLMSCDPKGVNNKALIAAAEKKIPAAGTGGTSMADTASLGVKIIAQSGTTGTTNRTRAVSAMSAFSKEWKLKFNPVIGGGNTNGGQESNVFKRISIRGIMMASMPGFIAMALSLAISKLPGLSDVEIIFTTLVDFLPVIVAAIAAKQISGMDEVGIVAGIVSGALSVDGGIIGGMAVGIISGILVHYISSFCFKHGVPGTTTNIASGGLSGLVSGFIGMYALSPIALMIGNGIKNAIDWTLDFNSILAGTVAGALIWFAIIGGVYHAAILPIILLEMEQTGFSFLGAIDIVCMITVCAGIQLAYIIKPRNAGDRTTATANVLINLAFGTFAEAAYPFMFSSKKVFGGTILSAALAGTLVGIFNVRTTSYVPMFLAPFMSNDKLVQTIIVLVSAFAISCVITLVANTGSKENSSFEL